MLGGWAVEHAGEPVEITGDRQRALLFRLALEPQSHLGYRAIAEDVWPDDPPENPRAALQSLVSRLRAQLPVDVVASTPGGYRLELPREAIDAVRFQDLVAAATASDDVGESTRLASEALELWQGAPWTPDAGYDWFERDLSRDHAAASARAGRPSDDRQFARLPAPLTELIGRASELESVAAQLELSRLVTILGPGGAGKTRLSLEAGRQHPPAVFVELAPAGPDEVWQAVLGALGRDIRTASGTDAGAAASVRERVVDAVRGRELLLVLDNCEHVIETAAELAAELLTAEARLRILTTSREPLGVPGEAFVPLGPLGDADAERLFADRVRAARGRAIETDEADAARRIRGRLDGLPLALELAAAKARTLTLHELAAGLDDRFALLSGGLRTALPRHQTLRALIDWSWTLLDDDERALLMASALYPAGVATLDAAEVAAAHSVPEATFDRLVDKSLLYRSRGRYQALETIREYGLERLGESGGLDARRREQAVRLADAVAHQDLRLRGPEIHGALRWFDEEDDNLASVLRYALAAALDAQAMRIVAGAAWYWIIRDRNEDAVGWLRQVAPLAAQGESDDALIIRAVSLMVGALAGVEDASGLALGVDLQSELDRLAELAQHSENDLLQVMPPLMRTFAASLAGDPLPTKLDLTADDSRALRPWPRAMLAAVRAALAHNVGDTAVLERSSAEAVELFAQLGDLWGLALARQMRSQWLALAGRFEEALDAAEEATVHLRAITSAWDLQQQQGLAVTLLVRMGRTDEARERATQLLDEAHVTGSSRALLFARLNATMLALTLGELDLAQEQFALAEQAAADWQSAPPQMTALVATASGRLAIATGRFADAVAALDGAASAAVLSGDQPVMASVAVALAELAWASGDAAGARDAIGIAETLRGAPDLSDPLEHALRERLSAAPDSDDPGTAGEFAAETARIRQILRR